MCARRPRRRTGYYIPVRCNCVSISLSISFTLINFNEETMKWNCFQVFNFSFLLHSRSPTHTLCVLSCLLPNSIYQIFFFCLKKKISSAHRSSSPPPSPPPLSSSQLLFTVVQKLFWSLEEKKKKTQKKQHIKNYIHWPLLLFESGKNTILLSDLSASLWRCFYMNAGRVWSFLILSYTHDVFNDEDDDNNKNHLKEPKKKEKRVARINSNGNNIHTNLSEDPLSFIV